MTNYLSLRMQTNDHMVFDLVSGYLHLVEDVMTFALLNRVSFDTVYFNKRVRNRVLQEFLTVIVTGIMRNEYDYTALVSVKSKLVLNMCPVIRRCTYRHRKGANKGTLCGRGFTTDKGSGDRYCNQCLCRNTSGACLGKMPVLSTVHTQMSALNVRWEDLDTRMQAVRVARARLCKACFH